MLLLRYFGRQYIMMLLTLGALLLSVVYFLELAELFRRAADKALVTTPLVLAMGLAKLPETGQKLLPFIVLFAAMAALWRLARRNELVMARVAGLSIWQFTAPLVVVALLFGIINTLALSPVSAMLLGHYKRMETRYLQNTSTLELSGSGLWLRQPYDDPTMGSGMVVIHAPRVTPGSVLMLSNAMILFFDADENYRARWDAHSGLLQKGRWQFHGVDQRAADGTVTKVAAASLPTRLTITRIEDSLAQPESLSFWELPHYIKMLNQTGFSSTRHRQHYYALMAQPVLFMAMVLVAAVFMQRQTRQGRALLALVSGVGAGVLVFVFNNTLLALGVSESLPTPLAAAVVPLATLFFATAALLHLEDA
jgi:lipopolysaccharide export system permease protein